MAAIGRLIKFARSPPGRRLIGEAQKIARDPNNRERLARVRTTVEERLPKRTDPETDEKDAHVISEPTPPGDGPA
jgi:hypothetical protein